MERILDINLDVLTSSYREEEMSRFLSLSRIEKTLLAGLKKTSSAPAPEGNSKAVG